MAEEKITAIVLAAGRGTRMEQDVPKQYLKVRGREILYYSLAAFEKSIADEVILVTGPEEIEFCRTQIVEKYGLTKVKKIIAGGETRCDSVYEGILAAEGSSLVLVHDGARPMVTPQIIREVCDGARQYENCTAGMPVKDTIKTADQRQMAVDTPDRSTLWQIQTPQGFSYDALRRSHEAYRKDRYRVPVTDDTMLVELFLRKKAKLVPGSYMNLKITTPEDLLSMEKFLDAGDGTKGRLRIRPFPVEYAGKPAAWVRSEKEFAMWNAGQFSWPLTEAQMVSYAEEFSSRPDTMILAALSETGEPVGQLSLRNIDYEAGSGHFGYILVNPEKRGRGTGKRMLQQALFYVCTCLGLKRITLGVCEANRPAIACYESIGFEKVSGSEIRKLTDGSEENWYTMAYESGLIQ